MKIVDNGLLTKREKDIVLRIIKSESKEQIARNLSLSPSTIKTNVENIYRKLNVHKKTEMIIFLIKNNMLILNEE